jgi:hypothetical protein
MTSEKRTIIKCETSKLDMISFVNIKNYSRMLLNLTEANRSYAKIFCDEIGDLSEIKESWWEFAEGTGDFESINDFVASRFKEVAAKWALTYITE